MISVIIPLYNKEPIIKQSLQSVLSQDYYDLEVIVVNDGSTDKSAEIVKSINDSRITLIEQENGGPSKARNTGIRHANGDWILFLDADDELLPGALLCYSKSIENAKNADIIVAPFYNDNAKDCVLMFPYEEGYLINPMKKSFFGKLLPRTGAFIYRKDIAVKCLFNEKITRYEDLDVLFRLYNIAKIYALAQPSMKVNEKYASASRGRQDINEDFVGHLDFKGKSFWEKMCLYKLYLGEREHYPGQIDKLYPQLRYRYDFLLLYKILNLFSK